MFTFVILSYNQEQYIIGHLESIKYQVENFGMGMPINLILSDDCSSDRTAQLAKIWLDENRSLFNEVKIHVNLENQGITRNYLLATSYVQTPFSKLLGADDFYHKNNIFETIELLDFYEVIFTPALTYNENGVNVYRDINNLLMLDTKESVQKYMKHSIPFNAVGTFKRTSVVQNEGLRAYISKYTWIEDLPLVYYLFNKKEHLDYSIIFNPYVIYRDTVGVSRNDDHDQNNVFKEEEIQVKTDLGMAIVERGLNLDYLKVAYDYKRIDLQANIIPRNRTIKRRIASEREEAQTYLDFLRKNAEDFYHTAQSRHGIKI